MVAEIDPEDLRTTMVGVWDANRKLDRVIWLWRARMKKRKRPILTPEEREEFARHQVELKKRIELLESRIAAARQQQT